MIIKLRENLSSTVSDGRQVLRHIYIYILNNEVYCDFIGTRYLFQRMIMAKINIFYTLLHSFTFNVYLRIWVIWSLTSWRNDTKIWKTNAFQYSFHFQYMKYKSLEVIYYVWHIQGVCEKVVISTPILKPILSTYSFCR